MHAETYNRPGTGAPAINELCGLLLTIVKKCVCVCVCLCVCVCVCVCGGGQGHLALLKN